MTRNHSSILVVDDNISTANSLVTVLNGAGFVAEPAYNGYDALRKVSVSEYDIVISDFEMPGMNGLELFQHIHNDGSTDIAAILLTGQLEQEFILKAIRMGVTDFLIKPVDSQHLIKTVQSLLEKRKDKWVYHEVSRFLEVADIHLSFTPLEFRHIDFLKVMNRFFHLNMILPNIFLNELLLIMEEMLYNAFIHGTLKLHLGERSLSYKDYQILISEKLCNPDIAKKRIILRIHIDQKKESITLEVEDEGEGFDYQYLLKSIESAEGIQLDEFGRGISIIYNLSDKLEFEKNGRLIRVEKKLNNAREAKQICI